MFGKGIEVEKGATILATKEFIKRHGKEGKLTLNIVTKKSLTGKLRLHTSLKAGDTVVLKLPEINVPEDEINLEGFGIEILNFS